ncbi:putative pathway-specific regulatory nit-4 [Pyrenophora seminiperda CCB06]|uniref:Putative pathway-specific regulatory nit-4 n=1 Tax=Pyrenophora seminiperda CCB06 TaxID=1302712 RepID=A0A3M7M4Q8_9PLEO|nr:putative pathway-specific regulatory nit-4 [Pyrenophora seminiperda CCB06]
MSVYRTECHYDAESESRRTKLGLAHNNNNAGTKRDASRVAASSSEDFSNAEFIINSLRKLPEENVYEFIQHIRRDPSLDTNALAEQWRKNETLTPNTPVDVQSLESELSVLLGKPIVTLNGQSRHFGHSASLGLVPEEENFCGGRLRTNLVKPERQGSTWTNVTDDLEFVEKLLDLYFTWSHPFYVLFSRECFYKDFKAGRDKYCCSLLVNAICAYACHLTDDPAGRTDPNNFRTAGDHFFAEARRMLFDDETPSLTTVQALCIMSMREPSTGRDSSGFGYMGRCIRMCIELGLHLNYGADATLDLTPSEVEVRKVTFWGCFTVDTVWTIVMGRISQIPRAAITLDKPILEETPGPPKAFPTTSHNPAGIITTRLFLQEFTSLSELVNDNNYMFFAPKEPLTSLKLLDCYRKYQEWYKRLSPAMRLEGKKEAEPHILVLHMLYHTIIVHLFRPLLKVDLIHSNIQPRVICINAANEVSKLVRLYRKFYSFRTAHLLIPHILLTVGVVHLLYSKDNETSKNNLIESLQGLEDLHECHYFGARSFRIIHTLAKTWNLPFPEELRNSKLIPKSDPDKPHGTVSPPTDPLLMAPNSQTMTGNRIGPGRIHPLPPQRRESLTMFASQNQNQNRQQLVTHLANSRPSSVVSNQGHQSPAVSHNPIQDVYNGLPISNYQYSQSMSTSANMPTTMTSPTQDTGEGMFWNPIPGMPGPILPRHNYQQMSPMGLETVLHTTDLEDRINRQGFRSVDDWQSSHINNYAGVYDGSNNHHPGNRGYPHHSNNFVPQQDTTGFSQGAHDGHAQESYDAAGWWQGPNGSSGPMS